MQYSILPSFVHTIVEHTRTQRKTNLRSMRDEKENVILIQSCIKKFCSLKNIFITLF